jgi:hypothetical protein
LCAEVALSTSSAALRIWRDECAARGTETRLGGWKSGWVFRFFVAGGCAFVATNAQRATYGTPQRALSARR